DGGGSAWTAGNCKGCHAGHRSGVAVPLPPTNWSNANLSSSNMRTALGINYPINGGIHLGGPGTASSINTKTTEAEICWGCHDGLAAPVSEWGYNVKSTPAGFPVVQFATANDGTAETFDFGWLYTSTSYTTKTSDWTAGYWMDQYDTLLRRRIASIHTASFEPAGQISSVGSNVRPDGTVERSFPALEDKDYIRCSYCHDVHDTTGPAGRPYLRGAWVGNPYPPELPPRLTYTYTTSVTDGTPTTPRGRSSARNKGGYFIDQNSNSPTLNTAMDTLGETAGLCTICHGSNVDTMKYYTGSSLWRTPPMTNGHSNSTLGGTGANKKNIFDANRTANGGMQMQMFLGGQPSAVIYDPGSGHYDFYDVGNTVYVSGWYGSDYSNWYTPGGIGSAPGLTGPNAATAHRFTCSKCHNPHASGLPALLTQNCVDPALGGFTQRGYWNQAGNCHRKTSTGDGWHKLSPAQ
ncbi:MAG TPA: hypothetical protein VK997_03845, partial [Deferrisomatales bacterium]|nr:hypothetical protein [Deferrisomatales bacterium]